MLGIPETGLELFPLPAEPSTVNRFQGIAKVSTLFQDFESLQIAGSHFGFCEKFLGLVEGEKTLNVIGMRELSEFVGGEIFPIDIIDFLGDGPDDFSGLFHRPSILGFDFDFHTLKIH